MKKEPILFSYILYFFCNFGMILLYFAPKKMIILYSKKGEIKIKLR